MEYKTIDTEGITFLRKIRGSDGLFFGMDSPSGDLYEAEELYRDGKLKEHRMIFVSSSGEVLDLFSLHGDGAFGDPVYLDGNIWYMAVLFSSRKILIAKYDVSAGSSGIAEVLDLEEVKDCYNLQLAVSPLTLIRQGHENDFQIVWPEKGNFPIDPHESFDFREEDRLVFSRWREDPEYREEAVIRSYPDGEILEILDGTLMVRETGEKWLLPNPKGETK